AMAIPVPCFSAPVRDMDVRIGLVEKDQDCCHTQTGLGVASPLQDTTVDDTRRHLRWQWPNPSSCMHFHSPENQAHSQDTPLRSRTHYPPTPDSPILLVHIVVRDPQFDFG
ncbi:hypothetical protein L210DRAFT_942457, partial [Boletus edulis BED1]